MASTMLLLGRRQIHRIFSVSTLSRRFSTSESGAEKKMIEKILIANRGEIACRIMKTAKRLGIQTVAVYSDADRDSLHVKLADEAIRIGPPPAKFSYLNSDSILQAATITAAQAIHPGYGFLSENYEFAQLCQDQGLSFIGPPASAIRDMGDKSASKRIMGKAGVPLVPGYHGSDQNIDLMKSEAEKIGYPVLIKPTHGGGGKCNICYISTDDGSRMLSETTLWKGMRIVQNRNEFVESFLAAQREAAASFGVDAILLEKYITRPRHIEVQIFGDKQGNVVYLYERDCSVQRRHQKIIEEAPAPNVSEEFRMQLGQAAVSAAKAVGYYSAGTVEFIVDTQSGQFYFMEMNTRLQVEHPVTEMIVGQDLVEWQIRVANGEPLPILQSEVPLSGHAFEARIYAENVPQGFLPATGVLHHYRPVQGSETVRVETGVEQGDTVSMHYDPMIAKLVVRGEDRGAALVKLKDCLSKFQVAGLPTNIEFLLKLSNHWAFENGEVETHFIEHHKDALFANSSYTELEEQIKKSATHNAMLVAACLCKMEINTSKGYHGETSPLSAWYSDPPFRVNYCAKRDVELEWEDDYASDGATSLKLVLTYQEDGSYFIEAGDCSLPGMEVKVVQIADQDFRVEAGGLGANITLAVYNKEKNKHIHIWHGSQHHHFRQKIGLESSAEDESEHGPISSETEAHTPGSVSAPMAGLVVKVLAKNGDSVKAGQPVLVMEAMKMEHVVTASTTGVVHGLQVDPGQQVSDGSILFLVKDK